MNFGDPLSATERKMTIHKYWSRNQLWNSSQRKEKSKIRKVDGRELFTSIQADSKRRILIHKHTNENTFEPHDKEKK